jgi:hemoglobin
MLTRHRAPGIATGQQFRFASLRSLPADDTGLPGDPEFSTALLG